jgi:hypothetical protein
MTAAAGEQDDCDDDQPEGVVIKQIAEAVIHNRSSLNKWKEQTSCLPFCYHFMADTEKREYFLSVFREKRGGLREEPSQVF